MMQGLNHRHKDSLDVRDCGQEKEKKKEKNHVYFMKLFRVSLPFHPNGNVLVPTVSWFGLLSLFLLIHSPLCFIS